MNRRTTALGTAATMFIFSAGGCALTQQAATDDPRELLLAGSAPLEEYEAAPPLRVASLGTGDALGRAIHVQDIILAAIEEVRRSRAAEAAVAEVPVD